MEAQKVLLLPVTSCFGAQEVLIAFALFGIIWACTISTVHWTQRAIAQVTHPARFTFTLHPGLDTRAILAGKPRETWLHFFAVGSIPSREATGTCYAISSAISVFTSSIWLTADTFAAFSCILPYPPSWVTVTTLSCRVVVPISKTLCFWRTGTFNFFFYNKHQQQNNDRACVLQHCSSVKFYGLNKDWQLFVFYRLDPKLNLRNRVSMLDKN